MVDTDRNELYLVLDQGTSSSKIFLYTAEGKIVHTERKRHRLEHPAPYHVESDPLEILNGCRSLISRALKKAFSLESPVKCAGFAFQRSTFLFWDRHNLRPLTPAVSWQDTRAHAETEVLGQYADYISRITGAPLSSHFGGPKFIHLVNRNDSLKKAVKQGQVLYGPLSSFITASLTGNHYVDESIAGRTLLVSLEGRQWDSTLCNIFQVPKPALPELVPTCYDFGKITVETQRIPLNCVIGDQQAALIGQGGLKEGDLAMNFGTSGSVQVNAGENAVRTEGLLSSVLYSDGDRRAYLLEGTINACNSLFYRLEKKLNIPHRKMQWHDRCDKTTVTGYFLPGFSGLAAPYWAEGLKTTSSGIPSGDHNQVIRAGMESIGFLVNDILEAIKIGSQINPDLITSSGGGSREPLLQFIADLTGLSVGHSIIKDRTAMGVFTMLRYYIGKKLKRPSVQCDKIFQPHYSQQDRDKKVRGWRDFLSSNGVEYDFGPAKKV